MGEVGSMGGAVAGVAVVGATVLAALLPPVDGIAVPTGPVVLGGAVADSDA